MSAYDGEQLANCFGSKHNGQKYFSVYWQIIDIKDFMLKVRFLTSPDKL